jgi:hypothetical protein
MADRIAKRATADGSKASITEEKPKAVGAAEELKDEVAKKKKEENKKREQAATAAGPSLGPRYEQVTQPRPWRDGVGRLWFKPSYPKRIGD